MTGKVHRTAYQCLDSEQITLLSLIMAFAEQDGLVSICDGKIIDLTKLTQKEFDEASGFLLKAKDVSRWCSAGKIERTVWYPDFECHYFTTGRFFVQWDSRRLNQHQWKKLKTLVFDRDDYTCSYCGERGGKLECDHIHPISKGGSNDLDNLTTACIDCNRSKRDKTMGEWVQ